MAGQDGLKFAQAVHDAYNKRDFAAAESLISEDFTWTVIPFGTPSRGVAGYRQVMRDWSTGFPDSQVVTTTEIDGGDYGVIEFIFRGTHNGLLNAPTGAIPPTGRAIEMLVCNVWRA